MILHGHVCYLYPGLMGVTWTSALTVCLVSQCETQISTAFPHRPHDRTQHIYHYTLCQLVLLYS